MKDSGETLFKKIKFKYERNAKSNQRKRKMPMSDAGTQTFSITKIEKDQNESYVGKSKEFNYSTEDHLSQMSPLEKNLNKNKFLTQRDTCENIMSECLKICNAEYIQTICAEKTAI